MHWTGSDQEDCRAVESPAEGGDCEFVMEWISTLFDFFPAVLGRQLALDGSRGEEGSVNKKWGLGR